MKDPKGHGSNARGGSKSSVADAILNNRSPAAQILHELRSGSYQNVSTKPLVSNATRDRLAAQELARGNPKADAAPIHPGASGRSVPIFDKSGTLHGQVSRQATSIGASKVAGGPVQFENHPTHGWGWRKR